MNVPLKAGDIKISRDPSHQWLVTFVHQVDERGVGWGVGSSFNEFKEALQYIRFYNFSDVIIIDGDKSKRYWIGEIFNNADLYIQLILTHG